MIGTDPRRHVDPEHFWSTPQKSQEQNLQQKLLDDQFSILQGTVKEAENIIQDAVAKLDDPLHIRCTSSPGRSRRVPNLDCICLTLIKVSISRRPIPTCSQPLKSI